MNILVVDDNSPFRIFIRRILMKAGYTVFIAENGDKAWEILTQEEVDAVITDWMMPKMDGIELVEKMRAKLPFPPAIIVVTGLALKEAFDKAIKVGADDYLSKPVLKEDLLKSIEKCIKMRGQYLRHHEISDDKDSDLPDFFAVSIAASTGGPMTLMNLILDLEPLENVSYFIVLHGPSWMLKSFVERVSPKCRLPIQLGEDNVKIKPGNIYLAPGDIHMIVDKENMVIKLSDTPPENYVKPSADPLFRSIASTFRKKSIAVILTGMGRDGTLGAGYIKTAGGFVIVQDPDTAIIASMPKSVIELRLAHKVSDINNIPKLIKDHIGEKA